MLLKWLLLVANVCFGGKLLLKGLILLDVMLVLLPHHRHKSAVRHSGTGSEPAVLVERPEPAGTGPPHQMDASQECWAVGSPLAGGRKVSWSVKKEGEGGEGAHREDCPDAATESYTPSQAVETYTGLLGSALTPSRPIVATWV